MPTPTPTPAPGNGGSCANQGRTQTCISGTVVFVNGAPAAGVCVYIQSLGGCLAVTDANGAWRGLINDPAGTAPPPQQNLIYQYGYSYGPQPIPSAAYVPGQSYSMGTFRLPF